MVGCPYKPRQRELRAPTEAVVGPIGVRNRRVSVQSDMNERSGERHALSAAWADRRSVPCGCSTRSRTSRVVHRSRGRSSDWGTGSLNPGAPAALSSPQERTAATASCVSIRCCESPGRKCASASSVGDEPMAGKQSASPKRADSKRDAPFGETHLLIPRPRPVARTIGESRVAAAPAMVHSARCRAMAGRHREQFRGRVVWE